MPQSVECEVTRRRKYWRAGNRSGCALVVHGGNVSLGCILIGDSGIEELFLLLRVKGTCKFQSRQTNNEHRNVSQARKKLLLIDTCHSGEVDKEESELVVSNTSGEGTVTSRSFRGVKVANKKGDGPSLGLQNSAELVQELFADLRRGSGAMVISSAGGAEYAYEAEEWSNGVFTFAVLEGLSKKKADENQDGEIRVSELRDYVTNRVQSLTQGKQTPTSRRENLEYDFRIR